MDIDGKSLKKLTRDGYGSSFKFSQNGKNIVFINNYNPSKEKGLFVVDTSGKEMKQLFKCQIGDRISSFDLSPDGDKIVFANGIEVDYGVGQDSIWIMDIDGHNCKELTDEGGRTRNNHFPTFHPSGKRFFFRSHKPGWSIVDVKYWTMDIDGKDVKEFTGRSYLWQPIDKIKDYKK